MKSDRMKEMSMEVTVGAFMFMILLALGFFTIVLSRENIFTKAYSLEVIFDNVKGLREGDNVFVRGVDVGKIKWLKVTPEGVYVKVTLQHPVKLHEDYMIEILPSSVLGGRYLNIYEGTHDKPLIAQGVLIRGTPPVDLIDETTRVVQQIRQALEEGGVLDNLKATMAQVKDLTARLDQGEGTIGKLLVDDKVYNDLTEITSNLREISGRLKDGKRSLGKLLSKDDELYTNLVATVNSMKDFSQSLSRGDGTLGKLAKDAELYDEATAMMHEFRGVIDDLRETTPITTFTSVFFGAF